MLSQVARRVIVAICGFGLVAGLAWGVPGVITAHSSATDTGGSSSNQGDAGPSDDALSAPTGAVTAYDIPADESLDTDDSTTYVYTPPGYDDSGKTRYRVLYLFHGTPGSSSDWFGTPDLTDELDVLISTGQIPPVIAVSPEISTDEVEDTECLDSTTGGPLIDTYLTQVVLPWVETTFPTAADREHRTLLGFSMGGFCATNLLFQHQDLFTAAGAMADYSDPGPDAAWLLATDEEYDAQSPRVYLTDPGFPVDDDLTLFLAVGELSEDVDVANTAEIAELARERGVTVAYEPDELNDHTWDMVDANLTDALVTLLSR